MNGHLTPACEMHRQKATMYEGYKIHVLEMRAARRPQIEKKCSFVFPEEVGHEAISIEP